MLGIGVPTSLMPVAKYVYSYRMYQKTPATAFPSSGHCADEQLGRGVYDRLTRVNISRRSGATGRARRFVPLLPPPYTNSLCSLCTGDVLEIDFFLNHGNSTT